MRYRDYLKTRRNGLIPESVELPAGYQLVGHVALLRLNERLWEYANQIGTWTIEYDSRIRSVAVKTGPTEGVTRKPAYRVVAGDLNTVTTHTEGGIKFRLDPLLVTFSRGNRQERMRLSAIVDNEEVVVDMFACVGQFSLPMAVAKSSRVFAIEIDSIAYGFLVENVKLNRVEKKVVTLLGDCREVRPLAVADRVVMGYLHDTFLYLPAALETLSDRGGIIHMHIASPKKSIAHLEELISAKAAERGFRVTTVVRKIKTYSPGVDHLVFDIRAIPK
jgi:tRNA wybutosine-synthesizing protein 2